MKVLSLFDGISCGRMALEGAGINVARYVAFEIDKYAISVSKFNYPDIEHRGSVVAADFSEFEGFDIVMGGFPCTDLSLAGRRAGLGGESSKLFWELVRAIEVVKPKYFLVENNYGMPPADFKIITDTLGVEPILINSALVSAQNRKRYYWTNISEITQPEDRGIYLKDILESGVGINTNEDNKSQTIKHQYYKNAMANFVRSGTFGATGVALKVCNVNPSGNGMNGNVYSEEGKSPCLTTNKGEGIKLIQVASLYENNAQAGRVYSIESKSVSLKAVADGGGAKTGLYAEPVCLNSKNTDGIQPSLSDRIYDINGKSTCVTGGFRPNIAIGILQNAHGYNKGKLFTEKAPTMTIRSYECNNHVIEKGSKGEAVIEVIDGKATIRGKEYKIKLSDGFYIIRKLTPIECECLQTLPDNYTAKGIDEKGNEVIISNSQRYKMLGNGWTVEVIKHIFEHAK